MLQVLLERLDLGATLPEAIAAPRASQRNTAATAAEPAFIASPERQALEDARTATRFTLDRPRSAPRPASSSSTAVASLAAAEPVRRGGGSAAETESP